MSETPGSLRGGMFTAARNGAVTLLAIGRTRIELLGNEVKEEKLHAVRLLLLWQVVALSLSIGTLLAFALLVALFWDNRIALLACFTTFFLAIAGLAFASLKGAARTHERMFAASLAELEEDLRQMKGAAGNESRTD